MTLRSLLTRPVADVGGWLLPIAALAGVGAVWLGLVALEVAMPTDPVAPGTWRDPVILSFALPLGGLLGLFIGPAVAWAWLRHAPLGAVVLGVGAAAWAGALAGLPIPLPAAWLATTVLAAGAATALLRRRYPASACGRSARAGT